MKTTLKRGMGRGAAVNGNGRAVYPPAVAPPMRRYRQPPPQERGFARVAGKILLWVVVLAVMGAGGVAGGTYLYVEQGIVEALGPRSRDVIEATRRLDIAVPGAPTTALVVGYDKRVGVEESVTGNSDTLMLLRADPNAETVSMLSFPRDLLVEVHGCKGRGPWLGRINMAYAECGSTASLETVRRLTGIPINYLVTVNFRGFKQIVSNLGGVWIDVDRRYFNDNSAGGERYATIDLQPGYQKLNGSKALDFVRYRHADSDLYRLARQQLFVKAAKQRLSQFSAFDVPKLVNVVTKNVEVGHAGATDFDVRTLIGYAYLAYKLPAGHFFQAKLDQDKLGEDAAFHILADEAAIQEAVADFTRPDVEAPAKATAVATGKKAGSTAPPPTETTFAVLNGNGKPGSAANAGYVLGQRGYVNVTGPNANAPSWEYIYTEVYYRPGVAGAPAAAERLAKLFSQARVRPLPPQLEQLSNGAMLTIVVGQTFNGTLAPAPRDRTPTRKPPQVKRDAETAALLRSVRRKVPFQLYGPTVVESTSFLARDTPLRVYEITDDHKAVRATFSTGASDYWGIQMTDWEEAPVLSERNFIRSIGGRRYELHYVGPKLHMVVLRQGGASYWVVNTLLDSLSNETMLAIAKGLKPLRTVR